MCNYIIYMLFIRMLDIGIVYIYMCSLNVDYINYSVIIIIIESFRSRFAAPRSRPIDVFGQLFSTTTAGTYIIIYP